MNNVNMRLQRERKMAMKEVQQQIKKTGKYQDTNFICLPDPENLKEWYYIIFGLEAEYKGGFYLGKINCSDEYPALAPVINVLTDNGIFRTEKMQSDGICLTISHHHQESWNPAWKVP